MSVFFDPIPFHMHQTLNSCQICHPQSRPRDLVSRCGSRLSYSCAARCWRAAARASPLVFLCCALLAGSRSRITSRIPVLRAAEGQPLEDHLSYSCAARCWRAAARGSPLVFLCCALLERESVALHLHACCGQLRFSDAQLVRHALCLGATHPLRRAQPRLVPALARSRGLALRVA